MSMPGVSRVMDGITARLQAGFPAKAAELNAEFADDLDVAVPATTSYHRMLDESDRDAILALVTPAVVLRPEVEEPQGGRDTGGEYALQNPIEVSVVVGYDTSERQGELLLRYQRALKEILLSQDPSYEGDFYDFHGSGFARKWTTPGGVLRDVAVLVSTTVYETP